VEFDNEGGVDLPVPTVAPGTEAIVEVPPPPACYDASGNCHFTIGVDVTNAVTESNETNNNAEGVCGASIL